MTKTQTTDRQKAALTFNAFYDVDTTTQRFLQTLVLKNPWEWSMLRQVFEGKKDVTITLVDRAVETPFHCLLVALFCKQLTVELGFKPKKLHLILTSLKKEQAGKLVTVNSTFDTTANRNVFLQDCFHRVMGTNVLLYKGGEEVGTIPVQLIMQHALRENKPDDKRRRQIRAILKKYRDLSANKEELAAVMKKKFGISIVYLGRKDNPFGYVLVDHKNKTVFKGGEFLSVKELLQFEDATTRFAKLQSTIDEILKDDPNATTGDINKLLYRQFSTRLHRGTVKWSDMSIELRQDVQEQLNRNNRVAMDLYPTPTQYVSRTPHVLVLCFFFKSLVNLHERLSSYRPYSR